MKNIKLILLCFVFISCNVKTEAQQKYDEPIAASLLKEDLQILKTNLKEVHPGLYAYHSKAEFDEKYEDIISQLDEQQTSLEFYRKLLPLLPLIANNHTKIKCPESYDSAISEKLPRFPFKLYHQEGKLFVHKDVSDEQIITPGLEIKSINGTSTGSILKIMLNNASTDGVNETLPYRAISAVFSKYYAYYIGTPKTFSIEYVDKDGKLQTATIKGLLATELNKRRVNAIGYTPPDRTIEFTIESDVAYLKIPSFIVENPRKFRNKIKDIFTQLSSKNISNLIIDVRDNGGGYGEAADEVFSYLISDTVFPYKDEFALVKEIPYPEYYEKDMFFKHFKKQPLERKGSTYHIKNLTSQHIKPKKMRYTGKLYVLQNAASASATGAFLGLVKSYTNTTFIGEEAGGNPTETTANDLLSMTLPNSGVRLTIPVLRSVMNLTFDHKGHGVIPDYKVKPTINDILNEKDVVIDFTYNLIQNNEKQ